MCVVGIKSVSGCCSIEFFVFPNDKMTASSLCVIQMLFDVYKWRKWYKRNKIFWTILALLQFQNRQQTTGPMPLHCEVKYVIRVCVVYFKMVNNIVLLLLLLFFYLLKASEMLRKHPLTQRICIWMRIYFPIQIILSGIGVNLFVQANPQKDSMYLFIAILMLFRSIFLSISRSFAV